MSQAFSSMHGSRGGRGGGGGPTPPPLKNHKYIGFLINTGTDPLTNHKATKSAFNDSMLGHHGHASETPCEWHFAGGPMMAPKIGRGIAILKRLQINPVYTKLQLLSFYTYLRALDHPILGQKFGPIPKSMFFSQFNKKNSQFDK